MYKWHDIQTSIVRRNNWTAANLLFQLLLMEANDYEIYMELGRCFSYLKMDNFATEHYEKAISLNRDSYRTHKSFAMHLVKIKQYDEAIGHFDFCIASEDSESDMKRSSFLIGYAQAQDHAQNHNDDVAEKYYKLAIKCDNKRFPVHCARSCQYYGQFLFKQERYDEALEQYEEALKYNPRNEWSHWKMSLIYSKLSKAEECGKCLKNALDINPNHRFAQRDYGRHFGYEYQSQPPQYKQNDANEYKQNDYQHPPMNDVRNCDLYQDEQQKNENKETSNYGKTTSYSSHSISTYEQSAASTTMSAYHPTSVYDREFNRLYVRKFGQDKEANQRFKRYLVKMQLKGLNDIRMVIKNDMNVLNKQMKKHCDLMDDSKDLASIMDLFQAIKNDYFLFQSVLECNGINDTERDQIQSNGVYSIEALKQFKTKDDVLALMAVTTEDNKMETNNIKITKGLDCSNSADRIFTLISLLNNGDND